jgi:hypothetical protein
MSFSPDVWGNAKWRCLHVAAAAATTKEKRKIYVEELNNFAITLPCEKCRLHFIENIKNHPVEPYAKSNISLFYHSWKLHDIVNGQLNKPTKQRLTYEEAFEFYFGRSSVHSQMTLAQLDNGEDIIQPHYNSREEDDRPQQYYDEQSSQIKNQQFIVRTPQSIKPSQQSNQGNHDHRSAKEVCHGDCGKPVYQVENSNFEAFREKDRRKFSAKNE